MNCKEKKIKTFNCLKFKTNFRYILCFIYSIKCIYLALCMGYEFAKLIIGDDERPLQPIIMIVVIYVNNLIFNIN